MYRGKSTTSASAVPPTIAVPAVGSGSLALPGALGFGVLTRKQDRQQVGPSGPGPGLVIATTRRKKSPGPVGGRRVPVTSPYGPRNAGVAGPQRPASGHRTGRGPLAALLPIVIMRLRIMRRRKRRRPGTVGGRELCVLGGATFRPPSARMTRRERRPANMSPGLDRDQRPGPEVDPVTVVEGQPDPGGYLPAVDQSAVLRPGI